MSSFSGVQGKSLYYFIAMQPVKDVSADHVSLKADCKRKKGPNQKEMSFYIFWLWKGGTSGDL